MNQVTYSDLLSPKQLEHSYVGVPKNSQSLVLVAIVVILCYYYHLDCALLLLFLLTRPVRF